MSRISRRGFLGSAGSVAALSGFWHAAGSAAPNERVQLAVIGTGGMGQNHVKGFDELAECDVVAVCDVDPERRAKARDSVANGVKPAAEENYRRVLDDPSIDAVLVATPDHWHAPVAIEALLAGKHVYLEKPCSHNPKEAWKLLEAAKETGKCVQHGTQSRSGEGIREAVEFLRSGQLGKIRAAKAINHQLRGPIGMASAEDPPAGVNYDLWLGPAPKHPFTRNRWHYNWHWFWDYGTGDAGNDGIHQIDIARWGLGVEYPRVVSAAGGQLFYNDDHETPDTQMVTFQYDTCCLIFEMRLWTNYKLEGHDNGTVFYGDEGILEVGREGCFVTRIGEQRRKLGGGADYQVHRQNFLDCIKGGDPSNLNAPVEEAAVSANLCHFANIATRVGRTLHFNESERTFRGDEEANGLLGREYREGYELPAVR